MLDQLRWLGLLGLGAVAGCTPCEALDEESTVVCTTQATGAPADTPFSVQARGKPHGNATFSDLTCTVDRLGSSLTLRVQGTSCGGGGTVPAANAPTVSCLLPALPAGTYIIGGRSVTVPSARGAADGLPGC